jgi:PKD repeat protein
MLNTFGITCPQWSSGFLDDAGEPIVLKDGIGQVKDSVYYLPTAPWPTSANNGGPSLTFCNTTLDNALGENWSASANQVAVNGLAQPIYASPGAMCSSGAKIVITEIMYNPPEEGTDSLEFIELYNAGNTINLLGFSFSAGVEYTFPSVTLTNGQFILVAAKASAIQNTFGKTALQWTSGGLNNTGEPITLKDNYGTIIDDVTYADSAPWDTLADGDGPSLTLCDPNSNNSQAINWKASTELAATNAAGVKIYATPLGGCVNPPTVANFDATPTFLIAGGSVQFHDLSTNTPISWDWTFPGGTPATSTQQNPLIQYNTAGVYSVTLKATNAYGNNTLTKPNYIGVGGVGITLLPSVVAVYPNPTSGKISVTNPNKEKQQIYIYSAVGTLVASTLSDEDIISLDLTGQPKGLYLVRITSETSLSTQVVKVILK